MADEVWEHLAAGGTVRVLIAFDEPEAAARGMEARREAVAGAQQRALDAMGPGGFAVRRRFQAVPALAGEISAAGLARLEHTPGVRRVDLDEGGSGGLLQSVPQIGANTLHALGWTGEGVTVAILDSGLDRDHPDLEDDLDGEACFCSGGGGCCPGGGATRVGPGAAEDNHGHGSNVTGIVTSKGVVAPVGVAPDARIVAIKVLDQNNAFCCSSDVVSGLDWILANRPDVDVVSMSLGTSALFAGACDNATSFTMAYASAINALRAAGVTSFVASMNNGSNSLMAAPACVAASLSVGAVYDDNFGTVGWGTCTDSGTAVLDHVVCFSNSNATTDLFAPGAFTTSDYLNGGTSTFAGTSQATPHAAGCAADLLEAHPGLPPAELEAILEATGVMVVDPKNGLSFPRIDCAEALASFSCGDGVPDPGEGCEDGNRVECDGCSRFCVPEADTDGDGDYDPCDNCVLLSNPNQSDVDGDGLGDVCDSCPTDPLNSDADLDGVCNASDNCPAIYNPGQENTDGDAFGNACDPCPSAATNDADQDGVCDNLDNCPGLQNPEQIDWDGDGLGNDCDGDIDGDGALNAADNCGKDPNPAQRDRDEDGQGDPCDEFRTVDDNGAAQFRTIQAAINSAAAGEVVLVRPGTYRENLVMKSGVDVLGSGPGLATIDGSLGLAASTVRIEDLAEGVRLSGFRLIGANVSLGRVGGAVHIVRTDAEVDGNVITGNAAEWGAAIYFEGDASFLNPAAAVITNNMIVGNHATVAGAVAFYYASPAVRLRHNTIASNTSDAVAGGVVVVYSEALEISQNLVIGNSSLEPDYGGGMQFFGTYAYDLVENDVHGNAPANYGGLADPTGTNGNLSVDPAFVSPGSLNYALQAGSPAVDAGALAGDPAYDLERSPRPLEGNGSPPARADMGALERVPGDADGDGAANASDNCPFAANPGQADADGDGTGDACDNCAAEPNLDQHDADRDGVGNVCDNCPVHPNPLQADTDSDGVGDACTLDSDGDGVGDGSDCAPFLASVFAPPQEVAAVTVVQGAGTDVGWVDQEGSAGPGTSYDIASGLVSALRTGGGFPGAVCLEAGVPLPPYADTASTPASREGRYYLVRAANTCGAGTYGNGTGSPDPRDLLDDPLADPCP